MITAKLTKENAAKLIGTRCAMNQTRAVFWAIKELLTQKSMQYLNTQ